jgi:hypothetical protein
MMKLTVQQKGSRIEHDLVPRLCELLRNVAGGLQTAKLKEALVLPHRVADQLRGACFTLRTDDDTLASM